MNIPDDIALEIRYEKTAKMRPNFAQRMLLVFVAISQACFDAARTGQMAQIEEQIT